MSSVKIVNLINALVERTEDREISWEATAWNNKFMCLLSGYSVGITQDEEFTTLTIEDALGEIIEQIRDNDLHGPYIQAAFKLRSLFVSARRNAKGADKAIDEIINSLNQ